MRSLEDEKGEGHRNGKETEGVVKRNEEAGRNEKEGGAERDDEGSERQR